MSVVTGGRALVRFTVVMPLVYAAMLIAVEVGLILRGHVLAGVIVDAALLLAALQVGVRDTLADELSPSERGRQAMLALALVPLTVVVAAGLPLHDGSEAAGTAVVAFLIGSAALFLAPAVGVRPTRIFAIGAPPLQLLAATAGLVLGLVAYLLGAPALWSAGAAGAHVLPICLVAAGAAVVEEFVFRGVIQPALQRAVGRVGLLAASALFASIYLNAGSAGVVLCIGLAGVVFAYVVARSGALSGAIAGHVAFVLGAGGMWPALFGHHHRAWLPGETATIVLAAATAGMAAILLLRDSSEQSRTDFPWPFAVDSTSGIPSHMTSGHLPPLAVDIVITNHNYGDFLAQAIDSACSQQHPWVNVIVVDDGSTDDSRERLRRYEAAVDVVLKEKGGQASAMNAGLARCHGDIVMFLDADDVLKPHAAARVAAAFATDPTVAKVQFRMDVIDAQGQATGATKPQPHIPMPSGDVRAAELTFPFDLSWLGCSGNAFRTSALRKILPIPERDYPVRGADWYLVHLAVLLGPVVSLREICASYRVHGRNGYEPQSSNLDLEHVRDTIRFSRATARALARLADELGLDRPDRILSFSELSNRLISLRLERELHPVQTDRTSTLVLDAARAVHRRFDVAWPLKAMLVSWFVATAMSPPALARRLAESFMFPERRASLDGLLSTLHRGPH